MVSLEILPYMNILGVIFYWVDTDIQEFYEITLDNPSKPVQVKTEETLGLVERWEKHPPPVPVEATDLAKQTLNDTVLWMCTCI